MTTLERAFEPTAPNAIPHYVEVTLEGRRSGHGIFFVGGGNAFAALPVCIIGKRDVARICKEAPGSMVHAMLDAQHGCDSWRQYQPGTPPTALRDYLVFEELEAMRSQGERDRAASDEKFNRLMAWLTWAGLAIAAGGVLVGLLVAVITTSPDSILGGWLLPPGH